MGVLNVTPDSFSGDGIDSNPERAVACAQRLVEEGADILDIGGESTRPGAKAIPEEEEIRRVIPVVEALARSSSVPISVDTRKAAVARKALEAGAEIIHEVKRVTPRLFKRCIHFLPIHSKS
jgi:dihydropteroate synthase